MDVDDRNGRHMVEPMSPMHIDDRNSCQNVVGMCLSMHVMKMNLAIAVDDVGVRCKSFGHRFIII